MYYFAYGSNMSTRRLQARLSDIEPLGYATLPGHEVVFHKCGYRDGSGKCGLLAGPDDAIAHGVVFRINAGQLPLLDEIEGVGHGYLRGEVTAKHETLGALPCVTYVATDLDTSLRPYHWYCQHVIVGASEHGLPVSYLDQLRVLPSIDDPDSQRHARELAIYASNCA